MWRPSARALLFVHALFVSVSPLQAAPDVTPWLSQRAGVARDDVATLMAESRELFAGRQLPEAAGERQALAALQFATDASERLSPEVVARAGGVDGVARALVAESARFYSSDVGGALLILAGERRSAIAEFIEGQLSPQAAYGQSARLLQSVGSADQDSLRFQARDRLATTGPQYLLAAALRGVDESGVAGQSPSDEQLLAVLVMHRGLNEDTARMLIAARHDFAATQRAFEEWQTAVQAQNAENDASAYAGEQRAATVTSIREVMPFVAVAMIVAALALALVLGRRRAPGGASAQGGRLAVWSGAALVVVAAVVAWMAVAHDDPVAELRQAWLLVALFLVALAVGLVARSEGARTNAASAVRGATAVLPLSLAVTLASAIVAVVGGQNMEALAFAVVGIFVAAAQASMGAVLGGDIGSAVDRLRGARTPHRGSWRNFLTVLSVVGAWASLNPLRLAPDAMPLLGPAAVVVVAGGVAGVIRGLVVAVRSGRASRVPDPSTIARSAAP